MGIGKCIALVLQFSLLCPLLSTSVHFLALLFPPLNGADFIPGPATALCGTTSPPGSPPWHSASTAPWRPLPQPRLPRWPRWPRWPCGRRCGPSAAPPVAWRSQPRLPRHGVAGVAVCGGRCAAAAGAWPVPLGRRRHRDDDGGIGICGACDVGGGHQTVGMETSAGSSWIRSANQLWSRENP